jgi:hypothetical protein
LLKSSKNKTGMSSASDSNLALARDTYRKVFGREPEIAVFAPGRVVSRLNLRK